MNEPHWDHLIHGHLDDSLTASELEEFESLILESASARRHFWELAEVHGLARESARLAWVWDEAVPFAAAEPARVKRAWLDWRPLAAAAAGLVVGLFCASMAWAYVAPSLGKVITLLQESFENVAPPEPSGLPGEIGKWGGDFTEIVGEKQSVKPANGGKMLRFLSADYVGKSDATPSRTASIWRLVDMRPYRREFADGGAVAQLSAMLNAQAFSQDRSYFGFVQIHALDVTMAAAIKERHWTELNASALAMTRSAWMELDRDPAAWQRIDCEQRLPGNADFLLIEIGLKQMPKTSQSAEFAGHFLDDVRLTFGRRPLLP